MIYLIRLKGKICQVLTFGADGELEREIVLADSVGARLTGPGLSEIALCSVKCGETFESNRDLRALRSQCLFPDGKCALIELLRLPIVPSLAANDLKTSLPLKYSPLSRPKIGEIYDE